MARPRCPLCDTKRMAGVMDCLRLAKDGVTEERLLERCDVCGRFATDAEAAIHYATRFGGRLRYDQRTIVWTPDTAAPDAKELVEKLLALPSTQRVAAFREMLMPEESVRRVTDAVRRTETLTDTIEEVTRG